MYTVHVNTVHVSDAQRRILSAAQELHEKHGLEAVSMRNVADAVGVVAAAIYRHYKDKDALIDQSTATRIILLSAYDTPEIERESYTRGADAFLHKPKAMMEIANIARTLLGD